MIFNFIQNWMGQFGRYQLSLRALIKAPKIIFADLKWQYFIYKIPFKNFRKIGKYKEIPKKLIDPPIQYRQTILSKYTRYRHWNNNPKAKRYVKFAKSLFTHRCSYKLFGLAGVTNSNETSKFDRFELFCRRLKDLVILENLHKEALQDPDADLFSLDNFTLSSTPMVGCSGVVYHAFLHTRIGPAVQEEEEPPEEEAEKLPPWSVGKFNLAVKVMFNFFPEADSPESILRVMGGELLPLHSRLIRGGEDDLSCQAWLSSRAHLPPHPNIVEILAAFVCPFPEDLPGAEENFPAALPSHYGEPSTLCLVMKRYHCNLEQYLTWAGGYPGPLAALSLLTQLLEALAWLQRHCVAHRDLKPNNILLDLSPGVWNPRLVLADFGHALVGSRDPSGSKGGNPHYMAPEVLLARDCELDYGKSDLWSVGALAYQLFGAPCPLKALRRGQCPPPPPTMPVPIAALVTSLLSTDPSQRPSVSLAATVCQLVLRPPHSVDSDGSALPSWLLRLWTESDVLASSLLRRVHYPGLLQALAFLRSHPPTLF